MSTHAVKLVVVNPALVRRLPPATPAAPAPERASVLTKAGRLRRELTAWARHGAVLVPREVRRARLSQCAGDEAAGRPRCPYYYAAGNLGLGECRYPGCGCTRAKTALATSRCPQTPPKWGPWVAMQGP